MTYFASSTQAFRDDKIPREYKCGTLYTMRKLAYGSAHIPASYQVSRQSLSVEKISIGGGGFAEVRIGKLGDRAVAVRTLRITQQTNKTESTKVCVAST